MGPKVFINCSGFIKIDTNSLSDSTEAYVEMLNGSRVHPETYEWARKMAVDAVEYDDDETNPAGALEKILEAPERLKDLDLFFFSLAIKKKNKLKFFFFCEIYQIFQFNFKKIQTGDFSRQESRCC